MALGSKIIPELKISALRPWYSECPTSLKNITITWKLVINTQSKTLLQINWIKSFVLSRFLNDLNAHWFWEAFFCQKALLELEKRCTLAGGHDREIHYSKDRTQAWRIKQEPGDSIPWQAHKSNQIYSGEKELVNGFKQRKNLSRFAFKIQFVCVALLSL